LTEHELVQPSDALLGLCDAFHQLVQNTLRALVSVEPVAEIGKRSATVLDQQ
jgi:hypothetical protein